LVLFEFVNNFMSLFYLAFYIQDFEMLKSQVTVMLIAIQSINHFQEALLPIVIRKGYVWVCSCSSSRSMQYEIGIRNKCILIFSWIS
jgi:hypothetical protein